MPHPTPRGLGYRFPAEWEPHQATLLSWPHDPVTFPDRVDKAEDVYRQMIRALAPHETVHLLVPDDDAHEKVERWLKTESIKNVRIHDIPPADVWFRDYGPSVLKRRVDGKSELAFVDWVFNAWGNKYETLLADDDIPRRLAPSFGVNVFEPGIVMEGGSIEVNGAGTLMTSEQCLLNKNRNPDLTQPEIESYLREYYGVRHFLWLGEGVAGDDTDGHIDDIARFTGPRTVVAAVEDDPNHPNHEVLAHNLHRLQRMTDQDGAPLRLVELPMPDDVPGDEGPLPASYANFYIANGVVLAPVFGCAKDERAVNVLRKLFPTRNVVPIRCEDLVWGMGTLHCVTQQVPAG